VLADLLLAGVLLLAWMLMLFALEWFYVDFALF
jgi:hypothetical protein